MEQKVNYLIIGQGLSGTWLSYFLNKNGYSFKVINHPSLPCATAVASGVINPVTGRRIVKTWMIEELLPFAVNAYKEMQAELGFEFIKKAPLVLIHPSEQMLQSFEDRLETDPTYLKKNRDKNWSPLFNTPYGTGEIEEGYWINLNLLLKKYKDKLIQQGNYREDEFDVSDLEIIEKKNNHQERLTTEVKWKNMVADKIIFCDGVQAISNPYFKELPFAPNKGEALIIEINDLPTHSIYKSKITLVPWRDNLFWVGSNYEWDFKDELPSAGFKEKMLETLNSLLKVPYTVIDHIVGVRPANRERRPFVGYLPSSPCVGILNGMGAKGATLAPYFANQLVQHDLNDTPLHDEANINRFFK